MVSSKQFDEVAALIDGGQFDEAVRRARAFAAGGMALGHALLARAYIEAERWNELRAELPTAIRRNPDLDWLRRFAAIDLNQHEKPAEALTAIHEAVRLSPHHPWNYVLESEILRRLGRHAEAVSAAEDALALQPDDVDARRELGRAYLAAGAHEDAATHLRFALDHGKYYRTALMQELADALEPLGRSADAALLRRIATRRLRRSRKEPVAGPVWANVLFGFFCFLGAAALVHQRGGPLIAAAGLYVVAVAFAVQGLRMASKDAALCNVDPQFRVWNGQP